MNLEPSPTWTASRVPASRPGSRAHQKAARQAGKPPAALSKRSSWGARTARVPSRQPWQPSLQAQGYRVGLYTSPHLVDFRERIRVNGAMIPEEILRRRIGQVRRANRERVTYFEFATALAFLHFARCRVDVAVLEVGMGGRLDATNVVRPELSVISNIALDHAEFLGRASQTSPWRRRGSSGGAACASRRPRRPPF
ncbi:MAG: Mur ligase family protein [Desulfobacterales bacterium]|nr:Mur ligase family protein [Desulfobacterales bacterium]